MLAASPFRVAHRDPRVFERGAPRGVALLYSRALSFVCALPFLALSCTAASNNSRGDDSPPATGGNGTTTADTGQEMDSTGPGGAATETDDSPTTGTEYPTPDKLVALTFDDGPNAAATGAVLDKLEAHQVPASFFLIGQNINAAAAPVLQRAAALGCEFENHSWGYSSLTGLTEEQIRTSVVDTAAAIEQYTGTTPVFFRPPNLATDALMYQVIELPFAGGIVAGDFPAQYGGNPTVDAVVNAVLSRVQDGSIILMHDVQAELEPHPTPEALDTIIVELKQRGYELVTLRQLFERRGVDPASRQDAIWESVPAN